MGAYLDSPVKDKNPEDGQTDMCRWGVCSMQGWRCGMEDSHIASSITLADGKKGMLFGVFDGHGGKEVATYAREEFQSVLEKVDEFKQGKYEKALEIAFCRFDDMVGEKRDYCNDTGTTSCVVLFTETDIYCANAGDSRGVLCRNSKPVELSFDHKPDNAEELKRIKTANHFVEDSRVDGNLALSRAFGDFQYKDQSELQQKDQAVTSFPDVTKNARHPDDKFIILACDGIWDCLSNEVCVEKLEQKQKKFNVISDSVSEMFDEILAPNTEDGIGTDNMTAVLIVFN